VEGNAEETNAGNAAKVAGLFGVAFVFAFVVFGVGVGVGAGAAFGVESIV